MKQTFAISAALVLSLALAGASYAQTKSAGQMSTGAMASHDAMSSGAMSSGDHMAMKKTKTSKKHQTAMSASAMSH